MSLKRAFDFTASLVGLILVSPVILVGAAAVRLESGAPSFFWQERVGRYGKTFRIAKLRTMRPAAAGGASQITVGNDARITPLGQWLRRCKIDELPQLFNVLAGEMSLVGPRPEVPKYIALYTPEQREILLSVRPGITDYAAIEYSDEAEILARSPDPISAYVNTIMPAKFALYEKYIKNQSFGLDLKLIFLTFAKLMR